MAAIPSLLSGVDKIMLALLSDDSRRYFEDICAQNSDLQSLKRLQLSWQRIYFLNRLPLINI
jgi:hypothetical protein